MSNAKFLKNNKLKEMYRLFVTIVANGEFPNFIPRKQLVVGLFGEFVDSNERIITGSEPQYLRKMLICNYTQMIAVDKSSKVCEINRKNKLGIRIIEGELADVIFKLRAENKVIALIDNDSMGSPEKETPSIIRITEAINSQKEKCVHIINVIPRPRAMKKDDPLLKITIVDRFSANKKLRKLLLFGKWIGWRKRIMKYSCPTRTSKTPMEAITLIKLEK